MCPHVPVSSAAFSRIWGVDALIRAVAGWVPGGVMGGGRVGAGWGAGWVTVQRSCSWAPRQRYTDGRVGSCCERAWEQSAREHRDVRAELSSARRASGSALSGWRRSLSPSPRPGTGQGESGSPRGRWAQVSGSRTFACWPRVREERPWWTTWSVAQGWGSSHCGAGLPAARSWGGRSTREPGTDLDVGADLTWPAVGRLQSGHWGLGVGKLEG